MRKINKSKRSKIRIALFLTLAILVTSAVTVFAGGNEMFKGKHGFGVKPTLEEMAERMGITVDELKAMQEERLAKIAEKRGITVDELKAQIAKRQEEMKAKQEERLAKIAEEKGITVDELKAQITKREEEMKAKREEMKAKQEERLAKIAEGKGITVDELKEQLKNNFKSKSFQGGPGEFGKPRFQGRQKMQGDPGKFRMPGRGSESRIKDPIGPCNGECNLGDI